MFSWMNPSLVVREGPLGKSVFASSPLAKDERLAVFGGFVMTLDEERHLPEEIRDLAHQIDDDLVIGIRQMSQIQPVDHFNHSCEPNAGFRDQITLVAMHDIPGREEVTFDYAMTVAGSSGGGYRLKCRCGTALCRGMVTDADWRDPALQHRYSGYFNPHVQRRIDSILGRIL